MPTYRTPKYMTMRTTPAERDCDNAGTLNYAVFKNDDNYYVRSIKCLKFHGIGPKPDEYYRNYQIALGHLSLNLLKTEGRYDTLLDYDELMKRISTLIKEGYTPGDAELHY